MKVRHACAIAGVAVAAGAAVFTQSLVATNDAQAPAAARRMLAEVPVAEGAKLARMELDWRPGGRVMQGPPMAVFAATDPAAPKDGVAVTKALFAQRRLPVPPAGTELTLVGRKGVRKTKIARIIDWERPVRGYPNMFVSPEFARGCADEEWTAFAVPGAEELAPAFKSDAGRNFDRAKALLLWAAALASICLIANTMLLSIEAKRRDIALARMLGMTRAGVARRTMREAFVLAAAGAALGCCGGLAAAALYVACDGGLFPEGFAPAWRHVAAVAAAVPFVAAAAALVSLRSAFAVRPAEAGGARTVRRRTAGMAVSFAFGFGAFVAVEVWGASLMKLFVPSPEWPDAIVSILPAGTSSFDIAKLKNIEGVERIAELQPLQANILPLEKLAPPPGRVVEKPSGAGKQGEKPGGGRGRGGRGQYRNALLLASDWLPDFKFVAGERAAAEKAVMNRDACIVPDMTVRAHGWKIGDLVRLDCGRGREMALEIAGIVDLNWHMVTSRGLLRGMNGMPVNTDGPLFTSFDTLAAADPRPQHYVPMTHLWLSFKKEFLAEHGAFGAGRLVEKEIAARLGAGPSNTVRLHSRDEVADGTLAHGADLIGSMARVPFIFIAVAALGFIAMTAAGADARRREFAVARACGATRARLAAVLALDAARTAAAGMALGLPAGALAGWLFTFATRKAMSNWGLPPAFAVPWETVAAGAAVAFFCALAVAVPAAFACACGKTGGRRA